ncbi:MAG: hypothetical protein WC091_20430 [Sulfuricellaceae bacterium]
MNIERASHRFIAIYGWQPVGILCAILLLSAVAADHFVSEYETLSADGVVLQKKNSDVKRKIGQQKQLEAVLKEKQEILAFQQEKGYAGLTPELAAPQLLDELHNLVLASHAQAPLGNALSPRVEQELTYLQAEVGFDARTQHLVSFLENVANSPKAMKIDMLDINVQDVEQPSMIVVKLAAQSFYVPPRKGGKPAGKN